MSETVLEATDLKQHYEIQRGFFEEKATLKAVDGISFALDRGRTLAIVGESGCGKSTLGRMVTMIEEPTSGSLKIAGTDAVSADSKTRARLRTEVQIVFQDPYGSLNPRQKIGSALEEPVVINKPDIGRAERRELARETLTSVGLRPEHYDRYPHMFSGGQRQRIAIARALMLDPKVIVLDEPVSALDVSIQAQVLNLLNRLQEERNLAYLFISHDLSVVRHVADEVMVMYLGHAVEHSPRDELFDHPRHPYSRALLSATPVADPRRRKERLVLTGELPSPIAPPSGCTFHPRCPWCFERCPKEDPKLLSAGPARVACHAVEEDRMGPPGTPPPETAEAGQA